MRRPRDRVPDQGSVLWNTVPWRRLLVTALVCGAIAGGCFWWSEVDLSRRGPVFLLAIGAIFACTASGCLLLIAWQSIARLLRRRRTPS